LIIAYQSAIAIRASSWLLNTPFPVRARQDVVSQKALKRHRIYSFMALINETILARKRALSALMEFSQKAFICCNKLAFVVVSPRRPTRPKVLTGSK
jgi:hypothetical protein